MQTSEDKFVLVHWIHESKVSVEPVDFVHGFDAANTEGQIFSIEYTGGKTRISGKKYDSFQGKILHTGGKRDCFYLFQFR